MFIVFLYMFRATMCPSSGDITVPMRRLVFVAPYRWLDRPKPTAGCSVNGRRRI